MPVDQCRHVWSKVPAQIRRPPDDHRLHYFGVALGRQKPPDLARHLIGENVGIESAHNDRPGRPRQAMIGAVSRHALQIQSGLLMHFADHVVVDVGNPLGEIARLQRTGGEIDVARIGGVLTHLDRDERIVEGHGHGMREDMFGAGSLRRIPPMQEGGIANRVAGSLDAAIAIVQA